MPAHTRIMRMLTLRLLAQVQSLAPRAASTRRRWLAAAPGLLLLRPSEPATAVTPGGEFCICNDKGCFGENCGGLKRPDVKYLGAATESYGAELSGASAALSGSVQLDQYPKSLICVHAMVLQDGGGALPALVSCGSAALAHARLKLYGLVAACGAAIPDEGSGRVLLDPSASEERAASSRLVAATVPELSHLPLLEQEGRAQFEAVAAALRHALGGAATVHERMREALLAEGQTASSARKRSRGGGGAVDAAA